MKFPAHPLAPAGVSVERTIVVEVYDDFPNIALGQLDLQECRAPRTIKVDQVITQQHRFNAKQADANAQPYDMWAFEGSSYDWGKDDVLKLTRTSAQPNAMGEQVKGGYGGGIPVVAMWTASVGEAIGHVETLPWTLSLPVKVQADGRVRAGIKIPVNTQC